MAHIDKAGGDTTVLVLGANGMLGNTALRFFNASPGYAVVGSIRSTETLSLFPPELRKRIVTGVDVLNVDSLARLLEETKPSVVLNCIGLVKQLAEVNDPLIAIPINAILPHRLARLCALVGARLVHISTDCVFAGTKGMYREHDVADAEDLYGRSKYLGEVDYPHAITLRTSLIGHELNSARGLVGWFLSREGEVKGYRHAIFSGFPTIELTRVIRDFVIPRDDLRGVHHVASQAINKYDLLNMLAKVYRKNTRIVPDDTVVVDRSLDGRQFQEVTGYVPPSWAELLNQMHEFR